VAFASAATTLVAGDSNKHYDVFVRDRQAGTTERVSVSSAGAEGDGDGFFPSISADGRFVTYSSGSDNLVAGDTNKSNDVFVRDRQAGNTELISVSTTGALGDSGSIYPVISADGRFVAYFSTADNLVPGDTNKAFDVFGVELK
jgi:Tol biopolymer transport system component